MPDTPKTDKNDIADNSVDFEFEPLPQPQAEKPAPNFTRRIQMLIAAIIIVGLAYTGAWFWFGSELVRGTETAIADAAAKGQIVTCQQAKAMGYPFRMGLTCARTGFADPAQSLKLEAGAFRSAAQVYQPTHIIGELDGPLNISARNLTPLSVNWALARASFSGEGGLPQRVSFAIEKAIVAQTGSPNQQSGFASYGEFHMRQGQNNQIDLASKLNNVELRDAPVFNISSDAAISGATRFDAALKSGKPLVEVLRGNEGELRNVSLTFSDGGSLIISGPFSLSESGLLTGTFSVKASQAGALIDNLSKVAIALGAPANNLAAIKAMAINDQFDLTITIKEGNASMGFIPLGKIQAI